MTSGREPVAATGLRDLLGELCDLKRIRSVGRTGSIAERGFCQAWAALAAGRPPETVMRSTVASALAAARLGDLDLGKLLELGLGPAEARAILLGAIEAVADPLDPGLVADLEAAVGHGAESGDIPRFAVSLSAQPRAGATCPGKPRLVLEPAESHAEHCWAVAVFGVLLSSRYGSDATTVFLAGLSHHLHNAVMPDSGFTGEMLLGAHLDPVCTAATNRALDELSAPLRETVVVAREILPSTSTAEGRAFHAADVLDRVLQLAQHLRSASLTMRDLLTDWELVHAGPVKSFHDCVLAEMGLA